MDIRIILLFTVSAITAILSFFMVRAEDNKQSSQTFSLFVLAASVWALFIAFFEISSDPTISLFFADTYYIAAAGIATFFLLFSLVFPDEKKLSKKHYVAILSPLIILSISLLIDSHLIIKSFYPTSWGKGVNIKIFPYLLYNVYFIIFIIWAYRNLFISYRNAQNINLKKQLELIFMGTMVPYLIGATTNLFLPWKTYHYIWIGPLVAFIMVITVTFAISKRNLLNVKVIGAEFFSVLLFIILLLRFLLSTSAQEFILGGIVLAIATVFALLLIRSVWKEVRTREELEVITQQLASANEKLKELDQAKTEFISIASHQLRTPLTAIKGYSSMIIEGTFGGTTKKVQDVIQKIYDSSQKLVLIIGNFLDVSRIELGKMQYEFGDFDLKEMVKTVVEETEVIIKKSPQKAKQLQIHFEPQAGKDYKIHADPNKIQQVVSNMVDNAMKYTEKGNIKVELSRDDLKKTVLVKIVDTGIGIPQKVIPLLFQKFARANGLSNLHSSGSGLGLYVAKEIVKEHKGQVWAESGGVGKGSTFYIELPVGGEDGEEREGLS